MSNDRATTLTYDRQLLLLGPKRNMILDLWEVFRYGTDTYGDANYVSVYGLQPGSWYARGIRLLGRTVVECTRDQLANAIGEDIAGIAGTSRAMVIDPFAGSANTLYWILHHLRDARGIGFEIDPQVYQLTKQNLSLLGLPVEYVQADYMHALRQLNVPADLFLIVFIAPPWGDALSVSNGLDLRGTTPPVRDIVDFLALLFPNPMLFAIQVYERIVPASLAELILPFEWSTLRIYNFNDLGQNHGLLLLTRGWRPDVEQ
jgi:16S rRNA G966 N2-methylase RsmD